MGFPDDKKVTFNTDQSSIAEELSTQGTTTATPGLPSTDSEISNIFEAGDCQLVIKHFELQSSHWQEEEYAHVVHYKDIYSTEHFSTRVREQLAYYPGMHSAGAGGTGPGPDKDPFKTNAQKMGDRNLNYWSESMTSPENFMEGLKNEDAGINYSEMFKGDSGDTAKNVASAVAKCVPCFDRIFDGAQLLPDGDLLEVHALNIKMRFDLLDKLKSLLKNPGFTVDICQLLKYFAGQCPEDLLTILALLTQYLAKLNLDFSVNSDLIIELIGPLLSPFLNAVTQWLDKWVQIILAPMICIIDNINMTIYTAQQLKLPLTEGQVNLGYDAGVAGPGLTNAASDGQFSVGLGQRYDAFDRSGYDEATGTPLRNKGKSYNPFLKAESNNSVFRTPSSQRYNPQSPVPPVEETELALAQAREGLFRRQEDNTEDSNGKKSYKDLSSQERQDLWSSIKTDYWVDENVDRPPPLTDTNPKDGTRWSKDNTPPSEKDLILNKNVSYETSAFPPEQQANPLNGTDYYIDAGDLVSPIIQMRNIVIGGVRYVQDWFKWATQLIYDLIGTDFGWMNKKMDNTILKSRIIQLIKMIKAILEAEAKNGLECGINTNFDSSHLRFILEDVMSKQGPYKFKARKDGDFDLILPTTASGSASGSQNASGINLPNDQPQGTIDNISSTSSTTDEQKTISSGIVVKDCLKQVKESEASKVREWIADFERRSNGR